MAKTPRMPTRRSARTNKGQYPRNNPAKGSGVPVPEARRTQDLDDDADDDWKRYTLRVGDIIEYKPYPYTEGVIIGPTPIIKIAPDIYGELEVNTVYALMSCSHYLFANHLQSLATEVECHNKRMEKRMGTDDTAAVDMENKKDATWAKRDWDTVSPLLKMRLKQAFDKVCLTDRIAQHTALEQFAKDNGLPFEKLSKTTFTEWMNDRRKAKRPLDQRTVMTLEKYVAAVVGTAEDV